MLLVHRVDSGGRRTCCPMLFWVLVALASLVMPVQASPGSQVPATMPAMAAAGAGSVAAVAIGAAAAAAADLIADRHLIPGMVAELLAGYIAKQ